ncbi:MAG: hypothetical protein U9R37_06880 [Campylobacterota bacterium]|nr:hypothetical protein [Campylobacterota bacterium]
MKKIDPLYILLLSFAILIVSIISLSDSKQELFNTQNEYKEFVKLSSQYSGLKNSWQSKNIDKKIEKVLKQSNIKKYDLSKTKNSIKIVVDDEPLNKLDKFINKILNDSFEIKKLDISDKKIELEVGYR